VEGNHSDDRTLEEEQGIGTFVSSFSFSFSSFLKQEELLEMLLPLFVGLFHLLGVLPRQIRMKNRFLPGFGIRVHIQMEDMQLVLQVEDTQLVHIQVELGR